MPEISGKIYLKENPALNQPVEVIVKLADTSKADLAATIISKEVYSEVDLFGLLGDGMSFQLTVDQVDPVRRYEISVLVDLDGDGRKGKGDYISKQAYPVLTKGYPQYVEVEVSII
jgi:uncharacterized lipoprotein YbaY